MIKNYFKTAWAKARSNKVSTGLYIAGVALAIATVMVLSLIFNVKLAPVYPENNRPRMAYSTMALLKREDGWGSSYSWSYQRLKEFFSNLENAEAVGWFKDKDYNNIIVAEENGREESLTPLYVNDGFFKVYDYDLVAGKALEAVDMSSQHKVAVVDASTAKKLFGDVKTALGKHLNINSNIYEIKGVVRDGSSAFQYSFANIFVPYTTEDNYDIVADIGPYRVVMLIKEGSDIEQLKSEVTQRIKTYNTMRKKADGMYYVTRDIVKSHYTQTFNPYLQWDETAPAEDKGISIYVVYALVLLLVPALNLSGLLIGDIRQRSTEIAVRKVFGDSRSALLARIIVENFILTIAGAIIGLAMAWVLIFTFSDWIFSLTDSWVIVNEDTNINLGMIFSPIVFGIALASALFLNIISSLLPAWWSLRRPIIENLNEQR